jgi:hypothetical protein
LTEDAAQPAEGLSRSRRALLSVHAARDEHLKAVLQAMRVELDEQRDPMDLLRDAAEGPEEPGRPRLHRLQVALAAIRALRRDTPPDPRDRERLRGVAAALTDPEAPPGETDTDPVDTVAAALEHAAAADVPETERWARVVQEAGPQLHQELRIFTKAWCVSGLRDLGREKVSRIETNLVVQDQRSLNQVAPALLPANWKRCNDFFCDLIRVRERDQDCLGTTGGELSATSAAWSGVYEERVGSCPLGWFPDTYLQFTWERSERQLILCYQLAPRRPGDLTVLRVDQGYIQVDRLFDHYEVSTVKYLLFDDQSVGGGGQTLGLAACELGWLDYCVNQFTTCAKDLAAQTAAAVTQPPRPPGIDAELQRVLDRCQTHLRESAADTDAQLRAAMTRLREGSYGLDEYVGDWAALVARGSRDGARSLWDQLELAIRAVDVARRLGRRRRVGL